MMANAAVPTKRSALHHWLRSFLLLLDWELRGLRIVLPIALVVQAMIGAGMIVGVGFLLGEIAKTQALYFSTGAMVISMISLGMVLTPQLIAEQKARGVYDYIWSLPVPRSAQLFAGVVTHSLIALPGMVLALTVADWQYQLDLEVSPLIVPATALTLATAATVGMAFAHLIPNPMVTGLVSQILVFLIVFFSPITYPPDRLPEWLAHLHAWLPFQHSANLMRASLSDGLAVDVGRSIVVLGLWATASGCATAWSVGRRR